MMENFIQCVILAVHQRDLICIKFTKISCVLDKLRSAETHLIIIRIHEIIWSSIVTDIK